MIDSKGRLFGKISVLDLGAACVIFLVVVGIFIYPGAGGSIAQMNSSKPIQVDVLVKGLSVSNFKALQAKFQEQKKANIVIRNQPAGEIEILNSKPLPRTTAVPQPDGSVKALPDPRPEVSMMQDMILTLGGQAEITNNGVVLNKTKKVKIGTPIQLEGADFDFNGSVIEVRVSNS
jgi:Domain of unknown function (DUF4330)